MFTWSSLPNFCYSVHPVQIADYKTTEFNPLLLLFLNESHFEDSIVVFIVSSQSFTFYDLYRLSKLEQQRIGVFFNAIYIFLQSKVIALEEYPKYIKSLSKYPQMPTPDEQNLLMECNVYACVVHTVCMYYTPF